VKHQSQVWSVCVPIPVVFMLLPVVPHNCPLWRQLELGSICPLTPGKRQVGDSLWHEYGGFCSPTTQTNLCIFIYALLSLFAVDH
jgi:hypothetical protein